MKFPQWNWPATSREEYRVPDGNKILKWTKGIILRGESFTKPPSTIKHLKVGSDGQVTLHSHWGNCYDWSVKFLCDVLCFCYLWGAFRRSYVTPNIRLCSYRFGTVVTVRTRVSKTLNYFTVIKSARRVVIINWE